MVVNKYQYYNTEDDFIASRRGELTDEQQNLTSVIY